MEEIKYACEIEIENVPVKWLPKIELFYPDLPGFPIMYIHALINNEHVYGFPVTMSVPTSAYNSDETCNIKFLFLCNKNISQDLTYYNRIKLDLENRIGIANAITKEHILDSCLDNKHKVFLSKLFDICSKLYGQKLPYGHFYEETYSIVRFVAAFQPKTGRQSEMRMLYNFLSTYGESIKIDSENLPNWSFVEFFL